MVAARNPECHKLINVLKKIERAQKPLRTRTETETTTLRAPHETIAESKRDRLARRANV